MVRDRQLCWDQGTIEAHPGTHAVALAHRGHVGHLDNGMQGLSRGGRLYRCMMLTLELLRICVDRFLP
jgi:hypothetical protein